MNQETLKSLLSHAINLAKRSVTSSEFLRFVSVLVPVLIALFIFDSSLPLLAFAGLAESQDPKEAEGKKEDPKESEGKKEDPKEESPENIKKLQQIISEKDRQIKELSKKTDVSTELQQQVQELLNKELSKELEILYPDIPPELLLGKSKEECDRLAKEMRERAKKIYGDSSFFSEKRYSSIEDIDKDIKVIMDDKRLSAQAKGIEVMRLSRLKNSLR